MAAKATAAVTVVMATMLVEAVTAVIKIRGIRRNESFCDAFCRSFARAFRRRDEKGSA